MVQEREVKQWITVNGKHVPIYEGESKEDAVKRVQNKQIQDDQDKKDKQIKDNAKKKDELNKEDKDRDVDNTRKQVLNLIDKDSYYNKPEYKDAQKEVSQAFEQKEEYTKKWLDLVKQVEKETIPDPEIMEMFGDKRMALELGKKTPLGEKLEKEKDEYYKKSRDAESRLEKARQTVAKITEKANKEQKVAYQQEGGMKVDKEKDSYKGFQKTTGVPYTDDLLQKGKAHIVTMSPKQYLQECAYHIFNSTYEKQLVVGAADAKGTDNLIHLMKSGTKMYMPYLNYRDSQQEGRHRAIAAMLLGINEMPVLIIDK